VGRGPRDAADGQPRADHRRRRGHLHEGEILSRGPDLCLGYTDDALTAKAFDDEGWYHTGDIGLLDDDGKSRSSSCRWTAWPRSRSSRRARQKWPEEAHAVDDFPRTASGKVQKFVLRKNIAEDL
jgi:acyl-CoA synthetase (AMP-forming)/AMP-acid ligase II